METCHLSEFMKSLTPWLTGDYIRKAYVNDEGHLIIFFRDGVQNVYQIDDCTQEQLKNVLNDLKKKGISVKG